MGVEASQATTTCTLLKQELHASAMDIESAGIFYVVHASTQRAAPSRTKPLFLIVLWRHTLVLMNMQRLTHARHMTRPERSDPREAAEVTHGSGPRWGTSAANDRKRRAATRGTIGQHGSAPFVRTRRGYNAMQARQGHGSESPKTPPSGGVTHFWRCARPEKKNRRHEKA